MKHTLHHIIGILVYFITPEDSSRSVRYGLLSADVKNNTVSLGSAKAVFWVLNVCLLFYLLSLI
ncbi:MAG: hypothetical protein MI862_12745 [Desulfobacterales bacterium]|nr:hypothetical protein [Desulfobacterales bacterium]